MVYVQHIRVICVEVSDSIRSLPLPLSILLLETRSLSLSLELTDWSDCLAGSLRNLSVCPQLCCGNSCDSVASFFFFVGAGAGLQ